MQPPMAYPNVLIFPLMVVSDLNDDDVAELVSVDNDNKKIIILLGYRPDHPSETIDISIISKLIFLKTVHVNNDSFIDILVLDDFNMITIFSQDENSTFRTFTNFTINDHQPAFIKAADINNDQHDDIIVGYLNVSTLTIHMNNHNGTFANGTTVYSITSIVKLIEIADLNGDEYVDIIVLYQNVTKIDILLNDGTGQVTYNRTISSAGTPELLTIKDMDMDQSLDLIIAYSNPNEVILYFNRNENFTENFVHSLDEKPNFIAIANVNDDTKPDIIISYFESNQLHVFFNPENGTMPYTVHVPTKEPMHAIWPIYGGPGFMFAMAEFETHMNILEITCVE